MKRLRNFFAGVLLVSLALASTSCKQKEDKNKQIVEDTSPAVTIAKSDFGTTQSGDLIEKYTLKNQKGMKVDIITYGGIITNWTAPDRNGNYRDVVLGYYKLTDYEANSPYFGALIGRYGNRIAKGKFKLDDKEYQVTVNDGLNSLHGGNKGFDKVVWKAEELPVANHSASIKLTYTSGDGEEGYPGNLTAVVTYTLTDDDALKVDYEATTDKKTVVNLTQHSYFNLTGDFNQTILGHELAIDANTFLPVDAGLIPTGEFKEVANTPFDFRTAKAIGKDIAADDDQLKKGKGYDHNWILNNQDQGMRTVASVYEPGSGRVLEIATDEPGIQFYSGNFLDGTLPAKNGGTYGHRTGFCLETQHYPDSPNEPDFPSTVLSPGETYKTTTIFKFSTK